MSTPNMDRVTTCPPRCSPRAQSVCAASPRRRRACVQRSRCLIGPRSAAARGEARSANPARLGWGTPCGVRSARRPAQARTDILTILSWIIVVISRRLRTGVSIARPKGAAAAPRTMMSCGAWFFALRPLSRRGSVKRGLNKTRGPRNVSRKVDDIRSACPVRPVRFP
jgi:hypothetical protein